MGEHTLQSSLFYRKRKDKIERLRVPYEAGVTLDSMANVGNDYSLGVELSTQLKVTKWWNLDVNGNIYYYKVMNNINSGGKKETSTNYDFTVNNLFGFIRIPVFSWTEFRGSFGYHTRAVGFFLVCQSGYSSAVVQSSSAIYPLLSGYIQFCPLQK